MINIIGTFVTYSKIYKKNIYIYTKRYYLKKNHKRNCDIINKKN